MQLYRYFVSQSSEFCRHNPFCCFSTSVYCCCYFVMTQSRNFWIYPRICSLFVFQWSFSTGIFPSKFNTFYHTCYMPEQNSSNINPIKIYLPSNKWHLNHTFVKILFCMAVKQQLQVLFILDAVK